MSLLPLFSRRLASLSDTEIKIAMEELRKLREEVAIAEVEAVLRRARSNVRVLYRRDGGPQAKGPSH